MEKQAEENIKYGWGWEPATVDLLHTMRIPPSLFTSRKPPGALHESVALARTIDEPWFRSARNRGRHVGDGEEANRFPGKPPPVLRFRGGGTDDRDAGRC